MTVGSAAARRARKQIAWGVVALIIVACAIGAAAFHFVTREAALDKMTLCPPGKPRGLVVLLVDKTDPLNFIQKQAFISLLEDLASRRIPVGHMVSVFAVGEDYKEYATPLLELCNPGQGDDKSPLTANIAKLQRQFRQRFKEPLLKQVDALQAAQPAKYSPIFEMLQLTSINAFRKHAIDGPRRLIVVSDMLHNTTQFSMYKSVPEYPAFEASEYGKRMRVELSDVQVELYYLLNTPQLQTRRHLKFWEDYFSRAGGRIVSVRPMEG